MNIPSVKDLFAANCHLGHKKEHSDPRFKKYIFGIRDGIYILDLEKTQSQLTEVLDFLKTFSKEGKTVLFVGTKRQAREITKKIAEKTSMPYIVSRWLGGTLTNFETIQSNINRFEELENKINSPEFAKLSKKEQSRDKKQAEGMKKSFEGLRKLKKLPDALFITDTAYENIAVLEAKKLGIPIIGVCDTNANPELVQEIIPANDEAKKSVELIVSLVGEALTSGKK